MEKIGQQFAANIRTNDLAFRYDTTTIAIILGETAEKEALMAVEKLRKMIAGGATARKGWRGERALAMEFSAGLAEAVVQESYDPVDIVTEVINRAEHSRWRARVVQGPGKVVALGAAMAAGAVA
jgi:GGDEF domain-containing protein